MASICILLATIDVLCNAIVTEMLKNCSHEVLHSGDPLDTLTAISEAKGRIRVVLTNLQRIESQVTTDILYHIQRKLHLQTFFMSPDEERIELKAHSGFVAYLVHSFNDNNLRNFWKISTIKSENVTKAIAMTSQMDSWNPNETTSIAPSSSSVMSAHESSNPNEMTSIASSSPSVKPVSEERNEEDASEKKDRVVWTDVLDILFLKALHTLDNPVPGEILKFMGVPGLNRKHVSSHLQKYRHRKDKKRKIDEMATENTKSCTKTSTMDKMPDSHPEYTSRGLSNVEIEEPTPTSPQVLSAPTQNNPPQQTVDSPEIGFHQQPEPAMPLVGEGDDAAWMADTFWDDPPSLD